MHSFRSNYQCVTDLVIAFTVVFKYTMCADYINEGLEIAPDTSISIDLSKRLFFGN